MDPIDSVSRSAGLDDTRTRLVELNGLAEKFGTTMTNSFAKGIVQGKSFDDILKQVGQKFLEMSLKAAMNPLQGLISSGLGALTQSLGGVFGSLFGGGGGIGGPIMPFADGGVIAAPSYFPLGRGAGLAGEAGPEAILPLTRGSDGRLGVAARGGGGAGTVIVNIQTPDIEGFARAESQVAAQLARAVARGRRAT